MTKLNKDPVLEANIRFHTALAKKYEKSQPYYDPINLERVTKILKEIAKKSGNGSLIDIGCGTGFICDIAKSIFKQIVGLDATPAMLSLAESSSNIDLILGDARNIPYPNDTFNACSAYGVLHHIKDLDSTINEIYRVLKSGGTFYADEDPNSDYFQLFENSPHEDVALSELFMKEYKNVTEKEEEMAEEFGVDKKTTRLAEYQKMTQGGMVPKEVKNKFIQQGFSDIQVEYRWFLGQASIRAKQGTKHEEIINNYLLSTLPLSKSMFKYFKIVARK